MEAELKPTGKFLDDSLENH